MSVASVGGISAPGTPGDTGPAGPNGTNGTNGTNGAAGADGAQGAQGAQGVAGAAGNSSLTFGTFSSSNSLTPRYLDTGANTRNALNTTEYFFPIDAAVSITSISVAQTAGTNTAIHRFEIWRSVGGAAFAATGKYLDLAVTAKYGLQVLASPLACAAGDRVGLCVHMQSGAIGSAAVNCVAKVNYT